MRTGDSGDLDQLAHVQLQLLVPLPLEAADCELVDPLVRVCTAAPGGHGSTTGLTSVVKQLERLLQGYLWPGGQKVVEAPHLGRSVLLLLLDLGAFTWLLSV